jgi:hypothetical protein
MPRDGAIIFSDLIGKLDVLRVTCAKCKRVGRYRLEKSARNWSDQCATPYQASDRGMTFALL